MTSKSQSTNPNSSIPTPSYRNTKAIQIKINIQPGCPCANTSNGFITIDRYRGETGHINSNA